MRIKGFLPLVGLVAVTVFLCRTSYSAPADESAQKTKRNDPRTRQLNNELNDGTDREALLSELNKVCLEGETGEELERSKTVCACIVRHHRESTPGKYLRDVISAYKGTKPFDSRSISDDVSIVLNNDADAIERCEEKAQKKATKSATPAKRGRGK